MKLCPTCNQTFEEDWLSFCTHDGTTLVDAQATPGESLPTVVSPAPNSTPLQSWLPNEGVQPNVQATEIAGVPIAEPQPQPVWQPPPPPSYLQPQSTGMAKASMIIGIASLACLGPIPGIVAIILGAMTLSQIKRNPDVVAGRQQALAGIITGSLAILIYGVGFIIYILFVIAMANQ
jgi:hypothetical protein